MNAKYLLLGALSLSSCFVVNNLLGGNECQPVCTDDGNVLLCDSQGEYTLLQCALEEGELCRPETLTCGDCGDGNLATGETCDDGNTTAGDGCSDKCQLESVCGDGVPEPPEQCDDGNRSNGDTCENDCSLPVCGNGIIDQSLGEDCEDGNTDNGDGCSEECKEEPAPDCGNGVREGAEACDDGNQQNGDACENDCTFPVCGNLIIDISLGEECEDGNQLDNDGCSSLCRDEVCGDGIVQIGEACDDGNQVDNDACDNNCQVSAGCGNGLIDAGEQCDDGNNSNGDGCSAACLSEACGDGVVQGGEQCDNGANNSDVFAGACRENCTNPRCGDGVTDFNEDCDNTNANCQQCNIVVATEEETNNSTAEADSRATEDASLEINSAAQISGLRQGDDMFRVELAQPIIARIEVFDGTGTDCNEIGNPDVRLLNAAGNQLAINEEEGIDVCPVIIASMPAGVFYIELEKNANNNLDYNYILEFMPLADLGDEVEGNNDFAFADSLIGPNVFVEGNHPTADDIDTYEIFVPQGASVRAQIFERGDGEVCNRDDIDSFLTLFDPQLNPISSNDDIRFSQAATDNFCSLIDGTGAFPKNIGASQLDEGIYFIQVSASPAANLDGEIFQYRLAVTIR